VYRRQPIPDREVRDPLLVTAREGVVHDDQSAGLAADCSWEGAIEIDGIAHLQRLSVHPQCPGRGLRLSHIGHSEWVGYIPEDRHAGDPGQDLLEELQAFRSELRSKGAQSGDIPPRPGKADHKPSSYGVTSRRHNDRDRAGGVLGGKRRGRAPGHDDIHLETDQLSREVGKPLGPSFCVPGLDDEV